MLELLLVELEEELLGLLRLELGITVLETCVLEDVETAATDDEELAVREYNSILLLPPQYSYLFPAQTMLQSPSLAFVLWPFKVLPQ